jgi:hypothetical protein
VSPPFCRDDDGCFHSVRDHVTSARLLTVQAIAFNAFTRPVAVVALALDVFIPINQIPVRREFYERTIVASAVF